MKQAAGANFASAGGGGRRLQQRQQRGVADFRQDRGCQVRVCAAQKVKQQERVCAQLVRAHGDQAAAQLTGAIRDPRPRSLFHAVHDRYEAGQPLRPSSQRAGHTVCAFGFREQLKNCFRLQQNGELCDEWDIGQVLPERRNLRGRRSVRDAVVELQPASQLARPGVVLGPEHVRVAAVKVLLVRQIGAPEIESAVGPCCVDQRHLSLEYLIELPGKVEQALPLLIFVRCTHTLVQPLHICFGKARITLRREVLQREDLPRYPAVLAAQSGEPGKGRVPRADKSAPSVRRPDASRRQQPREIPAQYGRHKLEVSASHVDEFRFAEVEQVGIVPGGQVREIPKAVSERLELVRRLAQERLQVGPVLQQSRRC